MNVLLEKLGDKRARYEVTQNIADGVTLLVRRALEHGHTETVRISPTRTVVMPQRELIGRLAVAAENGVFERQKAEAIVERILSTEAPPASSGAAEVER